MMNEPINPNELQRDRPNPNDFDQNTVQPDTSSSHSIIDEVGAVGGGILGATIGKSVKGNVGAVVGGVAGAIAGSVAANSVASFTQELLQETQPSLSLGWGADQKTIDLPNHYTWEELQALSKPQTQ